MKAVITSVILVLTVALAQAAPSKTVYSIGSDFANSAHWSLSSGGASCSCTPDISKDEIYIETNVSSSVGLVFGSQVEVYVDGNVVFNITGDSEFMNGSIVDVASGSTFNVYGDLLNRNESDEIYVDGTMYVDGNYTGNRGSEISGTGSLVTTGTMITLNPGGPGNPGMVFGSTDDCFTGFCSASQAGGVVLPVELSSFSEATAKKGTELTWATASEHNNSHFTLSGSTDGVNFEFIATINGQGTTPIETEYQYTVQQPYAYFRLTQTDFDGTVTKLGVWSSNSITTQAFTLTNQVCDDLCNVQLIHATEVVVNDMTGQVVFNGMVDAGAFNLSPWLNNAGVYFISAGGKTARLVHTSK